MEETKKDLEQTNENMGKIKTDQCYHTRLD